MPNAHTAAPDSVKSRPDKTQHVPSLIRSCAPMWCVRIRQKHMHVIHRQPVAHSAAFPAHLHDEKKCVRAPELPAFSTSDTSTPCALSSVYRTWPILQRHVPQFTAFETWSSSAGFPWHRQVGRWCWKSPPSNLAEARLTRQCFPGTATFSGTHPVGTVRNDC